MNQRPLVLLAGLFLIAGCTKQGGDDTAAVDDTAEEVWYESGCILVDGTGYANIEDAHTVVDDGGEISLADCPSPFDQKLVVTKSVSIVGPGADVMTWTAPVNDTALDIVGAADVTVSGVTLSSTRNALLVDSSSNVTLSELTFTDVSGTAIKATNTTGLVVTDSVFNAPQNGGLDVLGGSAEFNNNTVTAALGYALQATDGAVVSATNNTVSDVTFTELDPDGNISDGFAFKFENSSLTATDNTMTNNLVHMWVDTGSLDLSGGSMTGGLYGVYSIFGEAAVDGLTVTDAQTVGILLVSSTDDLSLTNSTVETDPTLAFYTEDPEGWSGGAAFLETDGNITVDAVSVGGFNAQGVRIAGRSDTAIASVNDLTITDVGRFGLVLSDVDATLTDVNVNTVRLVDDPTVVNQGGNISVGWGVYTQNADLTWTGGSLTDVAVVGALVRNSSATLRDLFIDNAGSDSIGLGGLGVWVLYGSLDIADSTLSNSPSFGGIANYYGSVTADNLTFVDNLWTYESASTWYRFGGSGATGTAGSTTVTTSGGFESNETKPGDEIYFYDTGETYVISSITSDTEVELADTLVTDLAGGSFYVREPVIYTRYFQSQDITSVGATSLTVTNSTFENGSDGIAVSGGDTEVELSNLTFTDYNGNALNFYRAETDPAYGSIDVDTVSITNAGSYGLGCTNTTLNLDDVSVSGVVGIDYKYEYINGDGEAVYAYEYVQNGLQAVYLTGCDVVVDGLAVSGAAFQALYAEDSSVELENASFTGSNLGDAATPLVQINWSSTPYLLGDGITTTGATGLGMQLQGPAADTGSVYIDGLESTGNAGAGLRITGLGTSVTLVDLNSHTNSDDGLQIAAGASPSLTGSALTGNGGYGLDVGLDVDGDGFKTPEDCDDTNPDANPGVTDEYTYSQVDLDCDGVAGNGSWTTYDYDGDGYTITTGDCDESSALAALRNPGVTETAGGIDYDCDGASLAIAGAVDVASSSITGNTLGGVWLEGATASITGSSVTGNTGWGMVCDGTTTLSDCSSTDLTGNTGGSHDGCGACDP